MGRRLGIPLRVVRSGPDPRAVETAEFLERALEQARAGRVVGIAAVLFARDDCYAVDVIGRARLDPTMARGAVCSLDDELREAVADQAQDAPARDF